jgi:hypothetical protein
MCTKFWLRNLNDIGYLGNLDADSKIILKLNPEETVCEDVDAVQLIQYRVQWQPPVDTI